MTAEVLVASEVLKKALVIERLAKARAALTLAPFDAVIAIAPANVDYLSGYRSFASSVHGTAGVAVVLTDDSLLLVGPVADSAPAFDAGIPETDYVAYGRFYFESDAGSARATALVDQHGSFVDAVGTALGQLAIASATIGIDAGAAPDSFWSALAAAFPAATLHPADGWLGDIRARKLPDEIELLRRSAELAEQGILNALAAFEAGTTERDLAAIVGAAFLDGGAEPRFLAVTSGPRSALADAHPTDRVIGFGDLIRFDVGATLEGYWSDIGRTAVVGEPTEKQRRYWDGIVAGLEGELALAAPGVSGQELFARAVEVTEASGGPLPYRRQHVGHGIGLTTYESIIVRPGDEGVLEPGMVFCFETPYYELGWGGMMLEDALVITDTGCERLTHRGRELIVVGA